MRRKKERNKLILFFVILYSFLFLGVSVAYGRSSSWTLVLALNAKGFLKKLAVILRSTTNTVPLDVAAMALNQKVMVQSTEKVCLKSEKE